MSEVSPIEAELVKATKFKKAKYPDRQQYLSALLEAIDKLTNEAYDSLSDEAFAWHKEAVPAREAKTPIPDFTEAEETEDATPVEEATEHDETGISEEQTAEAEATEEIQASVPEDGGHAGQQDGSGDKKAATKSKGKTAAPAKEAKKPSKKSPDYTALTGEKDRYGIIIGTKTAEAVKMYEKGCTAAQIYEALDGRFYNILKRLTGEGHRVEKLEGGVWKLTHKDDLKKKGK